MTKFLKDMTDIVPVCSIKSAKEKGSYGQPHLVLLRDERFDPDEVSLQILVPYSETYIDEEDRVEKIWLSWLDFYGNTFLPIDDNVPRKWVLLEDVDPEVLKLLQLVPPTKAQWQKVMV
jgi:hypothetical protein